jgi:hypothetical protein
MLNTSKVISKLIVLVLSVIATTTTAYAIERSQPSCDAIKNSVTTTQSKNRISSKLCSPRRKLFTLSYNYNLRDVSIYYDGKRTVLEKIKKDFDPKLVGAEQLIQLLPSELQPYLSQNVLLYISAIRTNGGSGGGQCGAGTEVYLNILDVKEKRAKSISRLLVKSCAESIEYLGNEESPPSLSGFSVVNNRLKIMFISYKEKEGSPAALLSDNLKLFEFIQK